MLATLLIIAKAPLPGQAKTRLIPALGAEGAAQLAQLFLQRTLASALEAKVGPVELCASPPPDSDAWRQIQLSPNLTLSDQGQGDLGERMARASERVLDRSGPVILIGTDCPALTPERLRAAARQLQSTDALLYPSHDGGYVLLGLRRFDLSLFRDIPWSTESVDALTRARIRALGWSLTIGETLQDIDDPEDLAHLPADLKARLG